MILDERVASHFNKGRDTKMLVVVIVEVAVPSTALSSPVDSAPN